MLSYVYLANVCSLVSVYIFITFGCSLSDIIMQTHVMWVLFFSCSIFFGGCWEVKQAAFDVWFQQFSMKSFYKLTFFFLTTVCILCTSFSSLLWSICHSHLEMHPKLVSKRSLRGLLILGIYVAMKFTKPHIFFIILIDMF